MKISQLVVLLLALGASLGALTWVSDGVTYKPGEKPIEVVKTEPTTGGRQIEKVWIGRPDPEPNFQMEKRDQLTGVGIPLIGDQTGLEEGRMRCARVSYDEATDRLLLEQPRIVLYEVDQAAKTVDRTRVTRLRSKQMLLTRDHRDASMKGDVVVTNMFRETKPTLRTDALDFALEDRTLDTDAPVLIEWGPDMTLTGDGMRGDANLEVLAVKSKGQVDLIQHGTRVVTPLEKVEVDEGTERTPIRATCVGELTAKRDEDNPSLNHLTLQEQVVVTRQTTTLTSRQLELWIRSQQKQATEGQPTGDAPPRAELRRLLATDEVIIRDPEQGECFGTRFSWEQRAEGRQWLELSGEPRLVSFNAGQIGLVDSEQPAEAVKERVEIRSNGMMTFDRRGPESTSPDPDVAVLTDAVKVVRTVTTDEGEQPPLLVDSDKMTMWMERVVRQREGREPRKVTLMRRSLAEGNVWVRDPTFECRGQKNLWRRLDDERETMEVTGTPRMVIRDVEDDRGMRMGGEEADPDAPPLRIDIEIDARSRLVLETGGEPADAAKGPAGRRLQFYDDVKVRRYALGEDGARVTPDKPLPSKLASDELDVALVRGEDRKGRSKMQMRRMDARGDVRLDDETGHSTCKVMEYARQDGLLTLIGEVVMHDNDGGRYEGQRMVYKRENRLATLYGLEAIPGERTGIPAIARTPVEIDEDGDEDEPKKKGANRFHIIKAPIIAFDRATGFLHAQTDQAKPWQWVDGRFYPSTEDGGFLGGDEEPEAGASEDRRPWALKCRDLKAWMIDRKRGAKRDKQQKGSRGSGRLKKMIATVRPGEQVQLSSIMPEGQEDKTQTARGVRFVHERKKLPSGGFKTLTSLFGDRRNRAEIRSPRELLRASLIRMDHDTDIAICPSGGESTFLEEEVKGKPTKVKVVCDGLIRYKRNKWMEFNQNVNVQRESDGTTIDCDKLHAVLNPKTREMKSALATGREVRVDRGNGDKAYGDRLDWQSERQQMILKRTPPQWCKLQRGNELFEAPEVHFDTKNGTMTTPKGIKKLR